MSHAAGRKPVYTAGQINRASSVCRKSFRVIIYKYMEEKNILGKTNIKTDVIMKGNRTQK
jgi:hypothetical protein